MPTILNAETAINVDNASLASGWLSARTQARSGYGVGHGQFDYQPGGAVSVTWKWRRDGLSTTPAQEYQFTLHDAETEAIESTIVAWTALPAQDTDQVLNFNLPNKAGTWILVCHLRRTSATSWTANSLDGLVSGVQAVSYDHIGRWRTSLGITNIRTQTSLGATPSVYAQPDVVELKWDTSDDAQAANLTLTQTAASMTDRTRDHQSRATIGTDTSTFQIGAAYPQAATPITVDLVPHESGLWGRGYGIGAGFDALPAQEQDKGWTVWDAASDGYVDYSTITKTDLFVADPRVYLSSDGATKNNSVSVRQQPRILRLFNRNKFVGTPGTEHAAWILNARGESIDVEPATVEVVDVETDTAEGVVTWTRTGNRINLTYTTPQTANVGPAPADDSGADKKHVVTCDIYASGDDGWTPTHEATTTLETGEGAAGSIIVTNRFVIDFDSRSTRDFAAYDPSTRRTKFVIATHSGYMVARLRDCQHEAAAFQNVVITTRNPNNVQKDLVNKSTDAAGFTDFDAGVAGLQGVRLSVETPAGAWHWRVDYNAFGNTAGEEAVIQYVSPYTGDVLAVLQHPAQHEPGARLRVWASFGRVQEGTLAPLWADGSIITVDGTPQYAIYQFSPDAPRVEIVPPSDMTPLNPGAGGAADWWFDWTPIQRRTYLIAVWAQLDGQLVTAHGSVRVERETDGLEFGTDRARGVRFVGTRGNDLDDVDELVVTDKTMASREAAGASADAILSDIADDEHEVVITRRDDPTPYSVGDTLTLAELGVSGVIVNVERNGNDVRLTVGAEAYRSGSSEARVVARVEKNERA